MEALRKTIAFGRFEEAQALLADHPDLAPESDADLYQLYRTLAPANALALILELARRHVARDPSSLVGIEMVSGSFLGQGDHASAREGYLRLLEFAPTHGPALCALGLIAQNDGEHDLAIDYYKRALDVAPKNATASENLRWLLYDKDRLQEFMPYEGNLIDWDSALFDGARKIHFSDNAQVRTAAAAVLDTGFVVLRQSVDLNLIGQLRRLIDAIDARPDAKPGERLNMGLDSFLALFQISPTDDMFINPLLTELLNEIFGQTPTINYKKSVIRRVRSDDPASHVPFHQDMRAFGVMGINVWAPLTPAGGEHPGLQLLPGRMRDLIEVEPASGEYSFVKINQTQFRFDEGLLVTPILAPGDCILFLGDVIHRSYLPPQPGAERMSLELRLFA